MLIKKVPSYPGRALIQFHKKGVDCQRFAFDDSQAGWQRRMGFSQAKDLGYSAQRSYPFKGISGPFFFYKGVQLLFCGIKGGSMFPAVQGTRDKVGKRRFVAGGRGATSILGG